MEYLKLLGILIIVVGFVLKWDTTAVVVIAAIVTGLFSGMDFVKLLEVIGKSFVENRMVSLFFLTLPMIGLVESHGLRDYTVNAKKKLSESEIDLIKGRSAAIDNFGNFFAQNLFVASGGVLLISSTMKSLGYKVDPVGIVVNTIPIAIITFVLVFAYNLYFDRQMAKWEGK